MGDGRRARDLILGLIVAGCVLFGLREPVRAESPPAVAHYRADVALESFLLTYWRQSLDYLRDQYPGDMATGYWTFAQGLDALLDGVERTGGQRFLGLVETLLEAQGRRGWESSRYDDESWMALAILRAHEFTGRAEYLAVSEELFADIRDAWDESCCGSSRGGIWLGRAHTQKATASNAGPVILGARLARLSGDASYLEFARRVYEHWLEDMVDPVTFQVMDHIDPDGTKVRWKYTYNEGLMIGAGMELYRATGESRYLETSRGIAGFMISAEVDGTEVGAILTDGDETQCTGDCPAYKGPAYRYLAELYRETRDPAYFEVLRASAEAIWQWAKVSPTVFFGVSWSKPADGPIYSEAQMAAAVMALNIFAQLSGPYPGPSTPPHRYEAEEATIHGVGIEAKYGDFSGWGYVAGWLGEGQGVDFHVPVVRAGSYNLTFRYAARSTNAVRTLDVNGGRLPFFVTFERTTVDSWGDYGTLTLEIELPAGDSVLSLAYEGTPSSNYLNLDYMELEYLPIFRRGDANVDGRLDVSDASLILKYLFSGEPEWPPCARSADADDSGEIEIVDPVYLLIHLFLDGAPVPRPRACGIDETPDGLGCDSFPPCE